MYTRISFVGTVLAATMSFSAAATAQTALVDTAAISAACSTSGAACTVAVRAAIVRLRAAGLTPAALNAQLGVIAGTAVRAAASLPPAQRVAVAASLREIAAASTNAGQIASITQVATAIEAGAGNIDLEAVADAFSAS